MEMKEHLLRVIRRSKRKVIITYPAVGWGNHLFQFLQADIWRAAGEETYLLRTPNMAPWLEVFPSLADLSVARMRVLDRRAMVLGFRFGDEFTREQLQSFCRRQMLSSEQFASRIEAMEARIEPETVVINVRRGDYYGTHFEPEFGMRIDAYVREALRRQEDLAPVSNIQFISDDLSWCKENFGSLEGSYSVSFTRPGLDMVDDLAALAAARRLILANSTFSYWGAYLSNTRGSSPEFVVAPGFHQKELVGKFAQPPFQDLAWSLIRELPGGWQPS